MKAPSKASLEFVQSIEDAVTDLVQLNIHVKSITQVHDAANREVHDLGNYVRRFIDIEAWDLICRLAEAYLKVGLRPSCITKALEAMPIGASDLKGPKIAPEPLTLQRAMPVRELPVAKTQATVLTQPIDKSDDVVDDLARVIRILERWDKINQRKLADQAYRWVGME